MPKRYKVLLYIKSLPHFHLFCRVFESKCTYLSRYQGTYLLQSSGALYIHRGCLLAFSLPSEARRFNKRKFCLGPTILWQAQQRNRRSVIVLQINPLWGHKSNAHCHFSQLKVPCFYLSKLIYFVHLVMVDPVVYEIGIA